MTKKKIRVAVGSVLYILLTWCFILTWEARYAARHPGLETLATSLLNMYPQNSLIHLDTSNLVLDIENEIFSCRGVIQNIPFSGEGHCRLRENDCDITFHTKGELASLVAPWRPISLFVAGNYQLSARIGGSWDLPKLHATATVEGGTIDHFSTGTHLEKVAVTINTDGKKAVIERLTATDGTGGLFSGIGEIEFEEGIATYTLSCSLQRAALIKLPHISALFSGRLSLKGSMEGASLQGSLTADSAILTLNEGKTAPKIVEITYVNANPEKPEIKASSSSFPLLLDIELAAAKNILIVDDSLNSEWKAAVKLKGSSSLPLLYGSLEMLEGTYLAGGKKIDIKEGTVRFAGDPIKGSTLSVVGTLETQPILAEAVVSGPLANPSITLRSTPPLSQADILSHLIFGRALSEISPQQSLHLRKSVKDLKGTSTGGGILDNVRSTLRLDTIAISQGSGNALEDVSVQFGKYLTRGLFVAFHKGISSPENRVVLEASLTQDLKLQAEINDAAEGQLHLKWRHDY